LKVEIRKHHKDDRDILVIHGLWDRQNQVYRELTLGAGKSSSQDKTDIKDILIQWLDALRDHHRWRVSQITAGLWAQIDEGELIRRQTEAQP
jgi:hypothetical protein